MVQRTLPLWPEPGQRVFTYTMLTNVRRKKWAEIGRATVASAARLVARFKEHTDLDTLELLNDVSGRLAVLDPRWFGFSVAVGTACLLPSKLSPEKIEAAFRASSSQRAVQVAPGAGPATG